MLPVEIWEEILQHADPADLVRLSRVCKNWYAIIPRIFERTDTWYRKCKDDVPEKFWGSILEQQHHSVVDWMNFHKAKNHPSVWIALYKSWMNWRKLVEKTADVNTITHIAKHRPDEQITCVAALTNIIAVGSSEGYVTFYDITKENHIKVDHALFIDDVHLWRNGADQIISTSTSNYGRIIHWNLYDKVSEAPSRGTMISTSFQYCYVISNNILTVDRPRINCEGNNENSLITLVKDRYELPRFGKAVAIGADRQEVTLWTEGNIHYQVCVNPEGYGYKIFTVHDPDIRIRCYKIFTPSVTACIGELGEFGFSIGGIKWKIYNLFSKFYSPVTAILFHVAVLVLGLGSGEVHLFAVKDVNSLQSLNFEAMKSKKLILDTEAIVSLNAMEHDLKIYLIATTATNLHVVKFD